MVFIIKPFLTFVIRMSRICTSEIYHFKYLINRKIQILRCSHIISYEHRLPT